jgi:tRNA pseudouridine13 synthase
MSSNQVNASPLPEWARVNAELPETATLRQYPEDFQVDEQLPFEPSHAGEFDLIRVEKTRSNTDWVAGQLANFAGVSPRDVSYAGLKDRHAVTRQWFSVHLPGRKSPAWSALQVSEFQVLESFRHHRKLRRGALSGNHFCVRLRDIKGRVEAVARRAERVREMGVPNYFGPQRFGREASNLRRARRYYRGEIKKPQRFALGMLHSAARAWLFNQVLSRRVIQGSWNRPLDGEVFSLDGSASVFGPEPTSDELLFRISSGDIHPTGPMWGRGALACSSKVKALEEAVAAADPDLLDGLEAAGLSQQRRSLRMPVRELRWEPVEQDLVLRFVLDRGCFATSVIRELVSATSASLQ